MKTILELLRELKGRDVSEFAMVSNRFPCVKVQGAFKPVDDVATSTAVILRMLQAVEGGARIGALSAQPTQWKTDVEGIGEITVMAVRKSDDLLQVRILPPATRKNSIAPKRPSPAPARKASTRRAPAVIPAELELDPPKAARRPSMKPSAPKPRSEKPGPPDRLVQAALEELLLRARDRRGGGVGFDGLDAPGLFAREIELQPPVKEISSIDLDTGRVDLDQLLQNARKKGASDLHVVAGRPPLYRIAGELVPDGMVLKADVTEAMLRGRVPDRLLPVLDSEGAVDFALAHPQHGRFRTNIARQRTGYKGSFRVIPTSIPTLHSLGLPEEIAKATHHHQGLIVLTGPTGHGKTSTLAALVDLINTSTTHHLITVEDPVEYLHPRKRAMISQREVGTHTKSFANALKGSLRQDPDVIVVGELRDTETVRMALSASETGHLVIGTMNTPSAAKTIDRLIDLFPPADQQQVRMTLAGGLRLIVSQRLLPNTHKTGMVAAAEVLPGSIALWNLIRDNKTFQIPSLQQRGKSVGIIRLDDSLAELVRAGKTTLETALFYAEDPAEMQLKATGTAPGAAAPTAAAAKDAGLFARAGSLFGGGKKG
jgi:twitching motility protein PilT